MRLDPVDLTFAILLALAVMRGYGKGLLAAVAGYVAPVLAFLVAADWSDPVRERIAAVMPAPDFVLDLLAPFAVFVVVVAVVRVGAALVSGLLGVGKSLPSRVGAGLLSAFVTGLVLGSFVLVTREMKPAAGASSGDDASQILLSPFENFVTGLDRRFEESHLAPRLADLAAVVVTTAAEHKDEFRLPTPETVEEFTREAAAAAAEATIRQIPVDEAARAVQGAATRAAADAARSVSDAAARTAEAAKKSADAAAKPAKPPGTTAAKPPEPNK